MKFQAGRCPVLNDSEPYKALSSYQHIIKLIDGAKNTPESRQRPPVLLTERYYYLNEKNNSATNYSSPLSYPAPSRRVEQITNGLFKVRNQNTVQFL